MSQHNEQRKNFFQRIAITWSRKAKREGPEVRGQARVPRGSSRGKPVIHVQQWDIALKSYLVVNDLCVCKGCHVSLPLNNAVQTTEGSKRLAWACQQAKPPVQPVAAQIPSSPTQTPWKNTPLHLCATRMSESFAVKLMSSNAPPRGRGHPLSSGSHCIHRYHEIQKQKVGRSEENQFLRELLSVQLGRGKGAVRESLFRMNDAPSQCHRRAGGGGIPRQLLWSEIEPRGANKF